MGFFFRKSIKIAPGFRLNLGRNGVGWSFGGKAVRITKSAGRKARMSTGLGPVTVSQTLGGVSASAPFGGGCVSTVLKGVAVLFVIGLLGSLFTARPPAPAPAVTANPVLAVAPVAQGPSFEERLAASQAAALKKYPALGDPQSPIALMYRHEYDRQRLAASHYLERAGWPIWLADHCAAKLQNPQLPPIPVDAPADPGAVDQGVAQAPAMVDATATPSVAPAVHAGKYVQGYRKKDGTWVDGYWRE